MCFYSLLNGALYIGRSKVFGKNWAASDKVKALRDEHEKAMPGFKFSESGYPVRVCGGPARSAAARTRAARSRWTRVCGRGPQPSVP